MNCCFQHSKTEDVSCIFLVFYFLIGRFVWDLKSSEKEKVSVESLL